MKRISLIICLIGAMMASMNLNAQTPEEIVERMSTELAKGDSLGMTFDLVMTIPIIGTFSSTNSILGDKMKLVVSGKDNTNISWDDGTTNWDYDSAKNEVTITNSKPKENNDTSNDPGLAASVSDGYDLSFDKKDDDNAWYIVCKKSRSNKSKDDPKRIDMAISKTTYLPIYTKTKAKGITISMENYVIGVTEEEVTFNPANYPTAKIIDER